MTTATTSETPISALAAPDHERARRALVPVAVVTALLSVFFETFRANSLRESLTMDAVSVVVTGLVYALVVRPGLRHESAPGRALTMSVLGLLLAYPAFWSGLPLVLGGAGALLGYAGKRASRRSGPCIAALVVGALAVLGYLAIYVADWISNPGSSWIGS